MPIGTIETDKPLNYKPVYGRPDRMPNFFEPMVVCDYSSHTVEYMHHSFPGDEGDLCMPAHETRPPGAKQLRYWEYIVGILPLASP